LRRAAGRLGGKTELVLFAIGGGVFYLATLLVVTLTWGTDLPLLGWIGFAVAATVVLAASTILAVFLVRSSAGAGSEPPQRRASRTAGTHRVLVVADEGCSGAALCSPLAERLVGRRPEVLVVAPALLSATHYLDSDVDAAREAAQTRLAETVAALEAAGISARGEVGSESPLEAVADALAVFAADEIVVATPPPERTNWLEQGVVERARELYEQPVSHLVVDAAPLELRSR
jgi:GABA permease